ncbi:MAG: magnesium/cobalt transporter CorA [Cyclobacteriaceae bacterium]|nr:magnesium/cobalt transporter CorA [Cyclobacteriaceae bacterium]
MEAFKPLRKISPLNRKKVDPGKFIFTGDKIHTDIDLQLFQYTKQQCLESKKIIPENIGEFEKNGSIYWLNIYGINDADTIASICKKQGIHNLVVQDILDVSQRPKFQEFDAFSFLTLKSIMHLEKHLISEQISFVIGENFLISFQERKANFFEHIRSRLREDKGILRERGVDYLLYTMLESILDNYFSTLNKIDEEIEKYNFTDADYEPSPNVLSLIENQKKIVNFIKKSILPIKEFALIVERGECQFFEQRHIKYFLEIKDLCLTLIDTCDMILTSLESSTNLFFSVQGHRSNQIMKVLTIVATVFIPLTFVAGIYGMNFSYMPELEWRYGYLMIWIIFILTIAGLFIYFRKKKWI